MKPRTAVFLIDTLNCGGTENNLLRLLPGLEKVGWNNIVVTLGKGGEMLPRFQESGIKVVTLEQGSFFSPRTLTAIARALIKLRPNIVVTNLLRADILGRIYLPIIIRCPVVSYLGTTYNHPRYRLARFFELITKVLARHYIANSEAVKDFYQKYIGVSKSKIQVVQAGIDIESFNRVSGEAVRQELKLPKSAFILTCVGNLAPNKGQTYLIEAFEKVFITSSNAYLLLVGEGENRATLEALRKRSHAASRIFLLGRRTDVAEILKITDIFVLPTLFEGLSVALQEAMAAGKAIITTDIPENRVILQDQKSALLCKPADTNSLVEALQKLVDEPNLRKGLADNALAAIAKDYSINSFAPKFAQALIAICQEKL